MNRLSAYALLLCSVLGSALASCSESTAPNHANACSDDSECKGDRVCIDGECVPGSGDGPTGSGGGASSSTGSGGSPLVPATSCLSAAKCVGSGDCESGYHCNTALQPPTCQQLYCGPAGTICSEDELCAPNLTCEMGGCSGTPMPDYPPGPYGMDQGSILPNWELSGYVGGGGNVQSIRPGDFYNPSGADLYPAGSPYGAGKPKPRALFIDLAAGWAAPSSSESSDLSSKYAQYHPMGGEFLEVLIEGTTPGMSASASNLSTWIAGHGITFPATINPTTTIQPLLDAYPTNLIVDLRTMQVAELLKGIPDSVFWTHYEQVLAGP